MRELLRVYRREAGAYFASPVAYLFIGVFLAVTLFVFFWVEAFFARNIADVQPLFGWMPILLIALVAALTMRSWSEERRADTIEVLFAAPVSPAALVGGKFLAALSLVALALLLTLPLPLTVEYLGPLDWGPVVGGYVAALFLAAAYVAMGLFVSARTDNPIVALMVTALIGGAFYVVGTDWLTALAPASVAEFMRWIGTGSRFDEITRGVLDLRDVYYYVSLVALFLALNVYSLEKLRWGGETAGARRHTAWRTAVALVALNFLVANVWLQPISAARADITADNRYSLSSVTHTRLSGLQEPLIIRGYISSNTHPLLKPLVPELRNLLREYDIAGGDNVRVKLVDPQQNAEAATRAQEQYGIEPVSMETASRYQSSVVSAWFHVQVQYGGERTVLNVTDLAEIHGDRGDKSVSLSNPEYELTRTIRKMVQQYRSGGNILATLDEPVTLNAYVSPSAQLPQQLASLREELRKTVEQMQSQAPGKLELNVQNPSAGDGALAERLRRERGIRPLRASLMTNQTFFFHLLLEQGDQTARVQLPSNLTASALKGAIESGLEEFGGGFLKTVAVYQPGPQGPRRNPRRTGMQYTNLIESLGDNASVMPTNLEDGRVPSEADMLMVLAPKTLSERQRFAIDQFMMRGGTVMVAASPHRVTIKPRQGLRAQQTSTGLESWLGQYGVDVGSSLVLDPQSGTLVIPRRGPSGAVRHKSMDYPYFIDVRSRGMADVPMLGNLDQVTMAWTSPVRVDGQKAGDLEVTPLLQSSPRAWTSEADSVLPDYQKYPQLGFEQPEERGRRNLAVMLEGSFTSAFAGEQSPLAGQSESSSASGSGSQSNQTQLPERFQNLPENVKEKMRQRLNQRQGKQQGAEQGQDKQSGPQVTTVIERSPADTRLVVFGSAAFATDSALTIMRQSTGTDYGAPMRLAQNVADYALEDPALLALRGGGQSSRLLRPVSDGTRVVLEAANYGLAAAGLGLIFVVQRGVSARRRRWYERILAREAD
jgi:ABC-2 type transport system permease protein